MTKLTLVPTKEDNDLFLKYQTQRQPQDAILCLNLETKELSAYVNCNIGPSISGRVFHDLDVEWKIPPLKVKPLKNLMDEVKELCEIIIENCKIEWDGSNCKGFLENDADCAVWQVEQIIQDNDFDPSQIWGYWDAADWFEPMGCDGVAEQYGITAKTTDKEIEDLAEKIEKEASEEQDMTLENTESYLEIVRDDLRDEEDEGENE